MQRSASGAGRLAGFDGLRRSLEECINELRGRLLLEVDSLERLVDAEAAGPVKSGLLDEDAAGPWLWRGSRVPTKQPPEPPAEDAPLEVSRQDFEACCCDLVQCGGDRPCLAVAEPSASFDSAAGGIVTSSPLQSSSSRSWRTRPRRVAVAASARRAAGVHAADAASPRRARSPSGQHAVADGAVACVLPVRASACKELADASAPGVGVLERPNNGCNPGPCNEVSGVGAAGGARGGGGRLGLPQEAGDEESSAEATLSSLSEFVLRPSQQQPFGCIRSFSRSTSPLSSGAKPRDVVDPSVPGLLRHLTLKETGCLPADNTDMSAPLPASAGLGHLGQVGRTRSRRSSMSAGNHRTELLFGGTYSSPSSKVSKRRTSSARNIGRVLMRRKARTVRAQAVGNTLSISSRDFATRMADELKGLQVQGPRRQGSQAGLEDLVTPAVLPARAELFFGCLIVSNAIFSGCEVQWMSGNLGERVPLVFVIIRHTYTMLFLAELAVRMYTCGGCCTFLCSAKEKAWCWLDVGCMISSLFELAVDIATLMVVNDDAAGSGIFRNIRLVRVIRLTRVFRISRIIRFVSALRQLVYSIAVTLKSLFWALVLFMMIWYVFGLALTMETVEYLGDAVEHGGDVHPELASNWGSLGRSMFALFMSISGGISWGELVEPLRLVSWFPVPLFTSYIAFTYFAVLNVVTAVFCTSAIETTQRNPEIVASENLHRKRCMYDHLRTLFRAIDSDGSGYVTLKEIEQISNDETARSWFNALDIDFRDAWTLFKLIDSENEGAIALDDFLRGCEQLQGRASTIALAEMQYDMRKMAMRIKSFIDENQRCEPFAPVKGGPYTMGAPNRLQKPDADVPVMPRGM